MLIDGLHKMKHQERIKTTSHNNLAKAIEKNEDIL